MKQCFMYIMHYYVNGMAYTALPRRCSHCQLWLVVVCGVGEAEASALESANLKLRQSWRRFLVVLRLYLDDAGGRGSRDARP